MAASEILDVVDEADRSVGTSSLKDCLEKGLLHRAVAVVVVRTNGEILLQRRNIHDRWHPGRWTLSSTGHVAHGEGYARAAKRELREELGIRSEVTLLGKFLLPKVRSAGLIEREHVALFQSRTDAPATPDPVELQEVRAFSVDEARRKARGRTFTPDAKVLLAEYLRLAGNDPGPR